MATSSLAMTARRPIWQRRLGGAIYWLVHLPGLLLALALLVFAGFGFALMAAVIFGRMQ